MELSFTIAKIIALCYIPVGISVLMGQTTVAKMLKGFEDNHALTFLSGILMVTAGVFLVEAHNVWAGDWTVLITIVAWAILLKGIAFILLPKTFMAFSHKVTLKMKGLGWVMLVLGLVMAYFGFFA